MNVRELKAKLELMPDDAEVCYIWDGEPRSTVSHVWLARCGVVMIADDGDVVYYAEDRPENAPEDDESCWFAGSVS